MHNAINDVAVISKFPGKYALDAVPDYTHTCTQVQK